MAQGRADQDLDTATCIGLMASFYSQHLRANAMTSQVTGQQIGPFPDDSFIITARLLDSTGQTHYYHNASHAQYDGIIAQLVYIEIDTTSGLVVGEISDNVKNFIDKPVYELYTKRLLQRREQHSKNMMKNEPFLGNEDRLISHSCYYAMDLGDGSTIVYTELVLKSKDDPNHTTWAFFTEVLDENWDKVHLVGQEETLKVEEEGSSFGGSQSQSDQHTQGASSSSQKSDQKGTHSSSAEEEKQK